MEAHRGDFWSRGPEETTFFYAAARARGDLTERLLSDQQLKAILSSAQYDKLKVGPPSSHAIGHSGKTGLAIKPLLNLWIRFANHKTRTAGG